MNLWNNLTNWVDNWFNSCSIKPKFRLVNFSINTSSFNNLVINNDKLNKLNIYTSGCNLFAINSRIKLISYKISTYNLNKINVN